MSALIEQLERKHVSYQVMQHAPTGAALEEARALGLYPGVVVKSVLIDTWYGHCVAVIPATRKLDMHLVRQAINDHSASIAREWEVLREAPEFPLGALPPFESMLHLPVYVDPEVLDHESVVIAVSPTESVRARTEDLFSSEWLTVVSLTHKPDPRAVGAEQVR